ncbi:methyl-accepting chemotaxis protein [Chamaesiphon sp.]|uniref:methyl-accepting chemotaxis protein n=1 Tax=Chamaesiphon sp. TaxID=2814140 RepID=UPI003593A108
MSNLNLSNSIPKIQQFVRSNLVATIVSSVGLNLVLIGASTWNVWNTSQSLKVTVEQQGNLQDLSSKVIYLDEVLTMSANMLASSGQPKWEQRYNEYVPELDKVTAKLFKDIPPSVRDAYHQIDDSNKQLIALEDRAFKLAKQRKLTEAAALLQSEEYSQQKRIYSQGVQTVIASIKTATNDRIQAQQLALDWSIGLELVSLGLLAITGTGIVIAVRGYIRDRQAAQTAIQASQANLQTLNLQLASEAQQRQAQEQLTRQENDQLQQDIGELLDVVSEIESGNLTIQAQVNDRATGLVGDTLNRLIEELGRTLQQVSTAARRVDANSKTQKQMAATVAQNTSKQAEAVSQMLLLTGNVRQSAQNTMQQLVVTNESLTALQSSVTQGQGTITTLDREIDILQAGSDRIVQEIKTLGEFVGLADRFVQDQGEIVTQTQILALNASLVAARAAEQRDPKQFAAVAREFELVATQVSQLAQQTNEGLTNLEQRSSQIHKVVSSVDLDVQKLGGLVTTFTQGVKQASDVFQTVQEVTAQAVRSGNLVAAASEKIVTATDSTTAAIESISSLSQQISHQSQDAQNLGDRLSLLSTDLLENIQVFKLPAVELSSAPSNEVALEFAV